MDTMLINSAHSSYLGDESGLRGEAESIVFPESAGELAKVFKDAITNGVPLTIQGSRTGLCGGSVPRGGLVVNLEKLRGALEIFQQGGRFYMRVGAGAQLSEIEKLAASRGLFFPPDPTEKSAAVGGVFATGGGGPGSLRYGESSRYVAALKWVLPTGDIWKIERGSCIFSGGRCTMPDGRELRVPQLSAPSICAHGIPREGEDLIDFLAGSEGRLGAAAEFTLTLLPLPEEIWGVVYFFQSGDIARKFLEALAQWNGKNPDVLRCAECFDGGALRLMTREKEKNALLKPLPDFPENAIFAVYTELECHDAKTLDAALMEQLDLFILAGGREEDTWAEGGLSGLKRFRDMRHAVPEIVGTASGYTEPELCRERIETDFSGPAEKLWDYVQMYESDAKSHGIECAVYGHALQNRLHAALLYRSPKELDVSRNLIEKWSEKVIADKGLLVSENGAGRIKSGLLERFMPPEEKRVREEIETWFRTVR